MLRGLRPLLGPEGCKFEVTCGNYAVGQLQNQTLLIALKNIITRLAQCIPF